MTFVSFYWLSVWDVGHTIMLYAVKPFPVVSSPYDVISCGFDYYIVIDFVVILWLPCIVVRALAVFDIFSLLSRTNFCCYQHVARIKAEMARLKEEEEARVRAEEEAERLEEERLCKLEEEVVILVSSTCMFVDKHTIPHWHKR